MANTPISWEEHLILIGKLVSNASVNETLMFSAFRVLSECKPHLAATIFYTLDSFPGKKALLNRVCKAVGDAEDKTFVDEIIAASEKSNNQRREVAHSLVYANEPGGKPQGMFIPKSPGAHKLVSKELGEHLMRNSFDAIQEAMKYFELLCRKHGVPPVPSFEQT